MKVRILPLLCCCIILRADPGLAQSTDQCSFQTIAFPLAQTTDASGINDQGAIVGTYEESARAGDAKGFLLFGGKFTSFNFPGAFRTFASDINNQSQIVGSYSDALLRSHGFLVHSGGFQTIDFPGAQDTVVTGISNKGDIVGWVDVENNNQVRGFLLHAGHFSPFSFPGAFVTHPGDINIHGVIVGSYQVALTGVPTHGFMVKNGTFTPIDVPGALDTFPTKVSDTGVIVGTYVTSDGGFFGFALVNDTFTTINDPNDGGDKRTSVNGINNHKQIVGQIGRASCRERV